MRPPHALHHRALRRGRDWHDTVPSCSSAGRHESPSAHRGAPDDLRVSMEADIVPWADLIDGSIAPKAFLRRPPHWPGAACWNARRCSRGFRQQRNSAGA
jgi:hypothetical protein